MSRIKIRDLISKGRVKEALEIASTVYKYDSVLSHQVNTLRSRFSTNESDNMVGVISRSDYTRENNQIVYALLSIAAQEPASSASEPAKPEPPKESPPVSSPLVNTTGSPNRIQPVAPSAGGLKIIELFLASSSELSDDRNAVEIWVNRENNKLVPKGIFLKLNLWEDFLDAMSMDRLQGEYNKAVVRSDIFISLYKTKVGKYTEEEFDVAYQNFKKNGKPKYIYTYFKKFQLDSSDINLDHLSSLKSFQKKLSDLNHFYTRYDNTPDLLRQLDNQLDKILEDLGFA